MMATPLAHADGQKVVIERLTRGGRKLTYQLNVLQQPERARACGSGSKSHTDRRPVDPPPVVELRIFENLPAGADVDAHKDKDITFHYNANFFLFTTLEHARPMANGRVQNPQANTPPVLTGMPVSAMAYLDRPREAGYFLFPDLSVRHEGRYKLSFNLYEETREEQDLDLDHASDVETKSSAPISPGASSFDWRMEIKSQGFNVFSAKKFPGLTESTSLSRNLSEQGCRVRIRRDVRMRKRPEGKPGDDEYARSRKSTPEPYRARSMSNASDHSVVHAAHAAHVVHVDAQRRPSQHEYPVPPPPYAAGQSAPSHLAFGSAAPKPGIAVPPYPASIPTNAPPVSPTTPYHQSSAHSSPFQTPLSQPYHSRSASQSQPTAPMPSPHEQERRLSNPIPQHVAVTAESTNGRMPPMLVLKSPLPASLPKFSDLGLPQPSPQSDSTPRTSDNRLPPLTKLLGEPLIEVDQNPDVDAPETLLNAGSKRRNGDELYACENPAKSYRSKSILNDTQGRASPAQGLYHRGSGDVKIRALLQGRFAE